MCGCVCGCARARQDPDGYWIEIIKRGGYDDKVRFCPLLLLLSAALLAISCMMPVCFGC